MKRMKKILTLLVTLALIFGNQVLAIEDPHGTDTFPHIGEGSRYFYNNSDSGSLGAELSYTVSAVDVEPGQALELSVSAGYIEGFGDGYDGDKELKDLLIVVEDYNGNVISDVKTLKAINRQHLGPGELLTETVNIVAPSVPGSYTYSFGVLDFGKYGGEWKHAVIAEDTFTLNVLAPGPTTYLMTIQSEIYLIEDGTITLDSIGGKLKVYTEDEILNANVTNEVYEVRVEENKILYVEAVANEGYSFYSWKDKIVNGVPLVSGESGYRRNPGSIKVTKDFGFIPQAVFIADEPIIPDPVEYTITFDPGEGILGAGEERVVVEEGGSFSPPTPTREGYTFNGWTYDPSVDSTDVQNSSTATANWTEDVVTTYTITFDPGEGILSAGEESVVVEEGGSFSPPTPTREGYTFNGWTYDPSVDSTDVQNSSTATANWTEDVVTTYTITFDPGEGTLGTGEESVVVEEGGSFSPPTPTREGYTFNGWTYSPSVDATNVLNSSSATASWTEDTVPDEVPDDPTPTRYTITFDPLGKGELGENEGSVTVTEGGSLTTPTPTPVVSGYIFDGWSFEPAIDLGDVQSSSTATAIWSTLNHTIVFDTNGGSLNFKSEEVSVPTRGVLVEPIPTKTGYTFLGWTYTPEIDINNVTSDATATALWSEIYVDPDSIEVFSIHGYEDEVGLAGALPTKFDFDNDGKSEVVESVVFRIYNAGDLNNIADGGSFESLDNIYEKRLYIPKGDKSVSIPYNNVSGYDTELYIAFDGNGKEVYIAEIEDFFTWYNEFYGREVISYSVSSSEVTISINTSNISVGTTEEEVELLSYFALTVLYERNANFEDEGIAEGIGIDDSSEDVLDEGAQEMNDEELPEAGGTGAVVFYSFGTFIAGLGTVIKRRCIR